MYVSVHKQTKIPKANEEEVKKELNVKLLE